MKKFTKILGFLGFFVTLAITQVGSAWAAGSVRCNAGYYLPAGVTECQECPGTVSVNGTNVGVYCPGSGDQEWIPDGETAQGLRYCNDEKACGNTSNWEYTEVGADSTSDCNGGLMNGCSCHSPNDFCPDDVVCRYNKFFTVSGTNFCGNCVIDTEDTNTWCPLTCPKSCDNGTCTCPGGDCTGYEEISGLPGVHYCNTAVDACDVTHLIQYENTSNAQIVEANPSDYQCKEQEGCEVHCDREGCPNNLPSGATCEYRDIPSPNTGHYNEKHECVDNNGDPVLSPGLCQYVVDCGENYHWDGSTCVGNDAKVTYICNNGTGEQGAGPIVQYGVDFYVNKQPNNANGGPVITCTAPNNQTFQGWSLTVGSTSYDGPYGNDYVFQPWDIPLPAGTSVVFTAKWSGTCYSVSFNDTQNGGHPSGWPNPTPGTHGPFYKKYNDPDNKWYDTPACDRPIEDPEDVNVSNNLPVKDNATFTGYYTRIHPVEIFNDNGVLTNDGQSWTINDNAVLYAHYECNANYHLDTNSNSQTYNQCIGNGVNVTYTCLPPVDSITPYSQTYQDATYNANYTVRAVGTGEYQVPCSFTGYEFTGNNLSAGYKWDLEGYTGSGDGQFAPGYIFQPWNYTTDQTFKLKCPECWRPKKYTVEYRCGTIDDDTYQNYSVSGNPTEDMASYGENYTVAASHVYEQPFLNSCEEPEGYTVQNWSLYCDKPRVAPIYIDDYDTLDVIEPWTYDYTTLGYDICYFIANWAHTDFKITLSQDGADPTSDPYPYLYTRYRLGVFLDSGRTVNMSPDNNPLRRTPQKPVTVTFDGDDGHNHVGVFEWNGNNNAAYGETGIDLKLDGFYENVQNSPDMYIDEEGYITENGHLAGRSYQTDETWVAHWKTGAVALPWPVNPPAGYTFVGWNCDGTLREGAQTIVISDNTECIAVFKEACYEVTFNDTEHGGPEDVTVANNPARYVKYGVTGENAWQTRWYIDSGCSVPWYVSGYLLTVDTPTKVHATFTGYYDEGENPDEQVFGSNGALTNDGQDWETQGDTTLYAQYTCDHMYHLMPDGSCGSCGTNEYWDATANNGAGDCVSCATGTSSQFPYSTPPFNWSINQCYNYCGSVPGTDEQFCDEDPSVGNLYDPSGFRIVDNNLSDQHKQIEFYGNYRVNVTACDGTVRYCAYGFVFGDGDNHEARIKPMTAPVDFLDGNGSDILGTRYIFGSRVGGYSIDVSPSSAKVWSQIVGPGQKTEENPGNGNYDNYYYTYIIYPTYLAPDETAIPGYDFLGYYYPRENGARYVAADKVLNDSIAASVLSDPTNTGDSNTARNLYANYELHNYTLSYDCNCPDGVNCEPNPADQQVQYQQPYTPATNTCTYTGHVFEGWMPSGSEPTITPDLPNGGFTPRRWPYTTDKTFKAKWSGVLTPTIHYENMDNATRPDDWETTMPNTYTCGTATPISGEPTLNNGVFVGWCTDAALSDCNVTQTIPANTECTDKTFYAQWECEAPYHLNAAGDNCVACLEGYFYDPSSPDLCTKCDDYLHATPGTWTTKPPYNWGAEQCYRVCGTDTNDDQDATTCQEFTGTVGNNVSIPSIEQFVTFNGGTGTQISFYGNEQDGIHTCRSRTGTNYCPFGLYSIIQVLDRHAEPMAAPVNFYDDDETFLDTHYIIGSRNAPAFTQISGPITWTRIAGAGQQYSVLNNPSNKYTYIVYPVTLAPEVSHPGYTIDGYVSPRGSSTEYVDDNLGLNTTNAQNILSGITNVIAGSRNLYAKYTQNEYTLTYNCGADDTGTPPESRNNIHFNDSINVEAPTGCSHWGNTEFRGWLVSGNGGTQQPGTIQWTYDSDKTFTAIWGDAQVFNITYELNGGTNYNGAPNSYVYGIGTTIGEGGLMPHRDYSEFLGWCDNENLTGHCSVTWTILPSETGNQTFYAKWECLSPYHEAQDGQSCTWCGDNQYWDADTQTCKSCSTETNGRFPYSKHPFNFSKNQCYNYCEVLYNRQVSCDPASIENTYDRCPFEKVDNSAKQIEFYGNDQANVTACDGTVQYCAYGFAGCNSPEALMKPMTAPVDFNKKTTFNGSYTSAGTRYIFGSRNGGNSIDLNPSTAKVWSQIVGPGQKTNMMNNANNSLGYYYYTHIIYPTYIAPDATISDHAFNGYYDSQTGGDMHVGSTYILNATNAQSVIFDNDLTGNSNNPRTLYAQYCGEGQHWDESAGDCKPNTINIVYESDYGNVPSSTTCTYSASFGLPAALTDTNHLFQYWKTNGDTNYNQFSGGETIYCTARYLGVSADGATATIKAIWDSASNVCQAQLPSNSNAHLVGDPTLDTNGNCVYNIQCNACIDTNPLAYGCYLHDNTTDFSVTVPQETTILNGAICDANSYDVYYRCNPNENGTQSDVQAIYGQPYRVENNGDTVDCSESGAQFSGWTFSGNAGQTYAGGTTIDTWLYYNLFRPTFTAVFSQCDEYQYYENGQCKDCPDGFQENPRPNSANECYRTCPGRCQESGCTTGIGHITDCHYISQEYTGYEYHNDQGNCYYNQQHEFLRCEYTVECESGYYVSSDGHSCEAEGKYVINLNANIGDFYGLNSAPNKLYTIHNTGVYLDSTHSFEMTPRPNNTNPLSDEPTKYATVHFYPNGNGASFVWNGSSYTTDVQTNKQFTFNGFYETASSNIQYIESDGYLTTAGQNAGKGLNGDATWYAQWTAPTIGTLPSSPQRPGYTFVGWYDDASVYGNPVTADATVNQRDMRVYAHWNAKTITVTLNANGGIAGSNFLSTLYQQYDLGWSRNQSGQFNSDFYLNPNELPVAQNESLRFKGYYTQRSDGSQMIANDGHVVTAPTHATDETWYAQYETSTGPFTVAFRCNSNSQPFYTNSNVYVNNNITVPANTNCSQNGMTFSQWKPTLHPSINMISAGASQTMYQWTYNFSEVFEPDWNAKVYEITLLPGDGAFGNFGVTKLYEKYGTGWSLSQTGPFNPSITLSGNALPSLAGYNFAGYIAQNGAWRGTVDNNVWTSPQPNIIGPETWYAKYTRCVTGQYYDDGQCNDCPIGYQLNPAAMSQDECYGQCDWYCTKSGCPTVGQNGVASCSYIGTEVSHSGINYWGAPQQCYTESQSLPLPMPATHPNCEHRITCIEPDYVYNPATDSCDQRKTSDITLLSHIFTDQGTVASPGTLYTVNGVGVFLDSAHQQQMTVNGHALSNTPTNYVNLTLNGNGVAFSWNGQTGNSPTGKAWLTFRGFYENQNSGTNNPMIGSNGYITQNGSNTGASYTQHRDWHAIWDNGSIEVPKPTRSGYVFDGWWTACNGGELKSMGDESVIITPSTASITWCAHWKAESYDVIYSCGTDPEWGGSAIDSDHPTYNGTYTVKDNNVVVQCSKPEYGFAGRWSFSEAVGSYNANQSISWVFQGGTPTFTAQYERCEPTQYVDLGACKDCPNGYPYHDYGATESTQCYAKDSIECIKQSDECDAPGVLYCTFVISGVPCKYYYPNGVDDCHTDGQVPNCEIDQIICKPEYTLVGRKCLPRDQYTITLNRNGGTGGQDKLYTIYQTNVYRDSDRTEAMSSTENPLLSYPTKSVTVTFKYCDGGNGGSCDNPVTTDQTVNVNSVFKGYYDTTSNGAAQYIRSNYFITDTGLNAGKSYQSNSYTWYAQWNGGTVSPWPNPTRSGYTFEGWWDQITGGTEVTANTTVSENVTWYAHWCEKCPSDIQHGTCAVVNPRTECAHKVVCEAGYQQNGLYCIPIGNLKLTYQPNGGTPTANLGNNGPNVNGEYVFSYYYGTEFWTLDYDVYTRDQHVLTGWERREPNNCLSPILDFDTLTTYNCQSDAVVRAKWLKCECTGTGPGFDHCTMSVENNKCKPTVYCEPGYMPNRIMACDDPYTTPCEVSCTKCPAGTYQHDDQCTQCEGDTISAAGVTECTPCSNGYHANPAHTECTPNTITIDWEENNGSYPDLDNGQCTYGGNLILEQAPQNAPEEVFLGWWLSNHGLGRKNAGASVQCEFDTTGVYEGISRDIQADWKHCACDQPLNPHVSSCIAYGHEGECYCIGVSCEPGYELVTSTINTCSPACVAGTSHVIYDCGTGSGTPPTPDNATYNEPYTVQNNTGCHKDNAPFVGWSFNGSLYAGGDVINPWTYTGDATFVAQYGTQCQLNEILINNTCVQCDCSYDDNSGVSTCNRYPIASNNCGGTPTCLPGYIRPSVNCTGPGSTNCTATCTPCGSTQISVGNTCEDCTCTGTGATCGRLSVTSNRCNWTPQCLDRYIGLNHNCHGGSNCNASCTECPAGWISNADHTNCIECDGGTYQNGNECVPCNTPGYTSLPGSTSEEDCNIPLQYTIEYQANGGVNARTHIAGQPEYQSDLTYNAGFVTYDGTIFTKTDSVIINWDRISGGDYTILNHWYEYNVTENTTLRAHWAQCECSTGAGSSSCGTLSTDGNTCNWTNPVCQDGYVSPNMQCTGTGNTNCTLTCGQCQEGEIIVNGECVQCTCSAGDGAASCTPGSTSNNACTATGQCSAGYGNDNGNANIECSGTNCVVSYNKCDDGWVSNANCECVICPENTYQDGNVCKDCPLGTTSPAGSTSASACTVSGFTLVYRSNNGQNRTVRENYDYMQSFITKPGTTFAWAGHIMTQWDTAENTGTKTFADGYAELNRNYVYSDVANIILDAHWEQCTCTEGEGVVADSCSPLSTNDNTCGCNATCNDGLRFAGCNCNGTACSPVCEPVTSNAVYTCGSGTGTGYSESVAFGATYHIKNNAWCVKDKSTFAGWKFNGDDVIYLGGDTITWNYKTDREFTALWCPSCSDPADHCELLIPNPGECQVTCNEGYRWDNDQKKCIAKTDLRLTYQPNGGKPNQNITDYFTYGQSFTTKPGTTYTKARHIMTHWNVESGGEHTFTAGIAQLNSPYTYKTDGDTVLSAQWQECADGTIVIGNECVACSCTEGAGVVHNSCSVQSTDNNLCTGTVECQDGYVGANVSCDGAQCTATCNACQSNEVSVNGECVECECTYTDDSGVASCGTSVVRNTCTQDPTCKPGYANPTLDCGGAGNAKCDAKCEICPAGTYGPDGHSCKPCPNGKTSYPGSTSINQCFIDPGSCDDDEHVEQGVCVPNVMECAAPDAYLATRTWNASIGTYGPCIIESCIEGYHILANTCVLNTCSISHGHGEYDSGSDTCYVTKCDPGYYESGNACVECENKIVDGDVAVSSYVSECEIAACMYQGQKYALDTKNNECVPICTADRFTLEDPDNPTGTIQWDERTKKCIRTCNPGYKMW